MENNFQILTKFYNETNTVKCQKCFPKNILQQNELAK